MAANSVMATSSFDRSNGNISAGDVEPLNNFLVNGQNGAPVIQGQINKIKLTEVMMPYGTPTVVKGRNDTVKLVVLKIENVGPGAWALTQSSGLVVVPEGFYSPQELQIAFEAQAAAVLAGLGAAGTLTTTINTDTNTIAFINPSVWNPVGSNYFVSIVPGDIDTAPRNSLLSRPQLYTTLGLRNILLKYPLLDNTFAPLPYLTPFLAPVGFAAVNGTNNLPTFPRGYYSSTMLSSPITCRYTDWIDIVSENLCASQYVSDSTTCQLAMRRNIITRLYIADETSTIPVFSHPFYDNWVGTVDLSNGDINMTANGPAVATEYWPAGSRPFTIHRQFMNPKVIKSTVQNAISAIDIKLYDMYGLPLPLPEDTATVLDAGPDDFHLTFLVDEGGAGEQSVNVGYRF